MSAELVYPFALTTLARVKDRLTLTNTDFDTKLVRMINAATEYIQNACGGRQFMQATYTNEVYSPGNSGEDTLLLRQTPVFSISSLQYRAGTPSAPSWTSFLVDQYELINPRPMPGNTGNMWYPEGMVRIYGSMSSSFANQVRVSYLAGYLIDWANVGDMTKHNLPADLSDLCENLVVRRFKRRELAGMQSQGLESANTSWRNNLDQDDLDVIDFYSSTPIFV